MNCHLAHKQCPWAIEEEIIFILQTRHLVCINETLVANESDTNGNLNTSCLTLNTLGNQSGPLEHPLNYFRMEV